MRLAPVLLGILLAGCPRDPAEEVCPEVTKGDLVITEIGGPQTGQDLLDPWIEVYNASGENLDLHGIRVRFRRGTGAEIGEFIVRAPVDAAAGAYTTLGLTLATADYIDYGFGGDFHVAFPSAAAVDIYACGASESIDQVRYDSLPNAGTYSLGAMPPTEAANDFPTMWCTDSTANAGSFPGTPQRANTACP